MPTTRSPRHGSLQFWPRKRAVKAVARVRSHSLPQEAGKIGGFAGYKTGMTHIISLDSRPHSPTKGMEISIPVTVLECPPLKVAGIRYYLGSKANGETLVKIEKDLARALPKSKKESKEYTGEFDNVRILVATQPSLTALPTKKPAVFELTLAGSKDEKTAAAKELLGKEIKVTDVFKPGDLVDTHAITKGKGTQGPVKRFGIGIKSHKSEKTKRGPGNLGPWTGNRSWTVAHAGQTGYHTRTEHNKLIMTISEDPKIAETAGGYIRYGNPKSTIILLQGSVQGPAKRLIRFQHALRPTKKAQAEGLQLKSVSKRSKQ